MILNDTQINALRGVIEPFAPQQVNNHAGIPVVSYGLGSYGYDVRLGNEFKVQNPGYLPTVSPHHSLPSVWSDVAGDMFVIQPGHFILARTLETITMPDDTIGLLVNKSTYARLGLTCEITVLQPGWHGHVTLELTNRGRLPIRLYADEGIAFLMFFKGIPPETVYQGKYQGQVGVQEAL